MDVEQKFVGKLVGGKVDYDALDSDESEDEDESEA
jgi:hypothetical protein